MRAQLTAFIAAECACLYRHMIADRDRDGMGDRAGEPDGSVSVRPRPKERSEGRRPADPRHRPIGQ
jgi:hypothetical protein